MDKEVEYNYETGVPKNVFATLNRKIAAYKSKHDYLKIGITGRDPQERFDEHLAEIEWERMIVIYRTSSMSYANTMEKWLIDEHWDDLTNRRRGGGSELAEEGYNFVYLLLA